MAAISKPVLVLGGGINGAAAARELLLNGVSVWLVDTSDVASGTTAYSSRLIHGGLRYLEYGEFDLVRESLEERSRLLRLAPHLVRPLRMFIPIGRRLGGFWQAAGRFLGCCAAGSARHAPRGLWLVGWGLWLYERFAQASQLPKGSVHRVGQSDTPPVDPHTYRWLCSYYDAQIDYPERLTVSLLEDARRLAQEQAIEFKVFTYHRAELVHRAERADGAVDIRPLQVSDDSSPAARLEPAAIINATGAWIDRALSRLPVSSPRLIGGTKGSHLLSCKGPLREALGGCGVYAEASDGRPVFLLPLGDAVLIGTTDIPFEDDPAEAVASDEELDYLLAAARGIFPHVDLSRADVRLHCCGVRPLPFVGGAAPASVTRRHRIEENDDSGVPVFSLIGGKLSTCRSLAEETVAAVLRRLAAKPTKNSRERPLPGGESYPRDEQELAEQQQRVAESLGYALEQVQAVWRLCGTQTARVLAAADRSERESLPGTSLPVALARHVIRREWVRRLGDLVERRLMLLYDPNLSVACLQKLARLMVEEGVLEERRAAAEVDDCLKRLRSHFGRRLENEPGRE